MNKESHYLQHHVLCSCFVHLRNVTDHAVCKACSGFVHIRKMTMLLAKPVVFWFYLHQDTVHVVCKACCVLVLFASGKRPCGLQSPLCSGFVCIRKTSMWFAKPVVFWFCSHQKNIHVVCKACCVLVLFVSGNCPCGLQSPLCSGFVRIGKTSMWFEKPAAFWFCLHQENVHVVCKACCVLVLFASGKRPCGLKSLLRSGFVCIRKTSMWFAKPVVFWFCLCQETVHVVCKARYVLVLFASGKRPCGLKSLLRSGFVCIRKTSMWFAKPVVFWFCLHQENVHVVWKACCVLVLFASGKRPCGLQSLLCSGFVCIRKTSMWFAKPVVFWFCSHRENVHVVWKACCILVLFASGKRPCGMQSLLCSGFVCIRKTSMWYAKHVVFRFVHIRKMSMRFAKPG